jgi:cytochrome c peroxidase
MHSCGIKGKVEPLSLQSLPAEIRLERSMTRSLPVLRAKTHRLSPRLAGKLPVVSSFIFFCCLLLLLAGCKSNISEKPIGPPIQITPPLGLPAVPIPVDNPPTAETIALGRRLFYDKRLSKGNVLACANCHNPQFHFTDGLQLSKGVADAVGVRNAPTLLNVAYQPFQFWDGRALSLEEQAASPMANPVEMDQSHKVSVSKLESDGTYREMFRKAFGTEEITLGRIEKALGSFERTLLSGNSPFDRYMYGGDKTALTPQQLRGLTIFLDPQKGNCAVCHTINSNYALFSDEKFHNIGEGVVDDGTFKDIGRFHQTGIVTDKGSFKTPTLRNVAQTAPYMHDGSLPTLRRVVDFYAGGGNSNPYLDKEIKSIHLSGQDRTDLVEFLKSLTGDMPPNVGPPGKE